MKKILIFSLSYYPRVSGAEIAVKEITDRIFPEKVSFSMVTLRFSKEQPIFQQIGNIAVHRVGHGDSYLSKILYIPYAALFVVRLHQKEKFNAFWALMSYMVLPVTLLRWGGLKLPYILTLQDGDPFEHVFERKRILPFKKLLTDGFIHASVVQVISTYLTTWARAVGYKGPIEIVPNGVSLELFTTKPENEVLEKTKEKLGKKKDEYWLVHTGRLVEKNALDMVIQTLPLLPPHIHFLMIGDGKEKHSLESLSKKLGVRDRVHFQPAMPNTELPKFLHASDAFIRPSRTEGLGTSFLEAFAVGIPVIATQEGGIKDFLFDEIKNPFHKPTGFAVEVDSKESIAKKVSYVVQNPQKVKEVLQNAQVLVKDIYNWERIAKEMEDKVFSRVLNV